MAEDLKPVTDIAEKLGKALSAATSAPAGTQASDNLIFGMTMAGLVLAFVFGLFGLAYVAYAKKQMKVIVGLCGFGLMIFPFFITNTWAITVTGVVLCLLPFVLKRVDIDF